MRFPSVTGSNLERRKYDLPQDFEGELNLVFIAFQQVHQLDVNTWLPTAKQLVAMHPGLAYYELPTIRSMSWFSRAMIDGGMRMGIPDRGAREATITLYIDKRPFRAALGIPDENNIVVLLVDGRGEVQWRTTGPHDARKGAELETAVAGLLEPAVA